MVLHLPNYNFHQKETLIIGFLGTLFDACTIVKFRIFLNYANILFPIGGACSLEGLCHHF